MPIERSDSSHSCVRQRHFCSDRLRCIDCVPAHVKNDHIIGGYRLQYSYWEAVKSLFSLHNETLNVWSHLAGIVLFVYLLYDVVVHAPTIQSLMQLMDGQLGGIESLLAGRDAGALLSGEAAELLRSEATALLHGWQRIRSEFLERSVVSLLARMARLERSVLGDGPLPPVGELQQLAGQLHADFSGFLQLLEQATRSADRELDHHLVPLWPLVCFLCGSILCFAFSSLFHLFCAVGERETYVFYQKFDYAGISLIMMGGYSPIMFYLYDLGAIRIYYLLAAQLLAAGILVFLFTDAAYTPAWRTFRVFLFIVYGLLAGVPIMHATAVLADDHPFFFDAVVRLAITGACLVVAAIVFYLVRIPERLASGRFDIWLQSHQLWHLSIIVAAMLHYRMSYDLWRFSHFSLLGLI